MRSTLAIAAVAAAAIAVSAEDCNPSYNVASSGTCFTNCNVVSNLECVHASVYYQILMMLLLLECW